MPSKYTLYNDDSVCDLDSDAERLSSLVAREHTPADLCEQGLQLPGPPSTTRSDDPLKQNIAREPASAAELWESPRGIREPSHTLHAEMHTVEETVPKVYVTDTDAESMICHNGSVYGSSHDGDAANSTAAPDTPNMRSCRVPLTRQPREKVIPFVRGLYNPVLQKNRLPPILQVLERVDRCRLNHPARPDTAVGSEKGPRAGR